MKSGLLKKTKQTAADHAQKTAKQVIREPAEILKSTIPQHLREKGEKQKKNNSPSLVSEIVEGGDKKVEEAIGEEAANAQVKKRLKELEGEIEKIRQERKAKEKEWRKSQEALMEPEEPEQKSVIELQGKKRRGFMGIGKKKQGTKEMAKQRSG